MEYSTYLVKKWFTVGDTPVVPGLYAIRKELSTIDIGLEYGFIEIGDTHQLQGESIAPVEFFQ